MQGRNLHKSNNAELSINQMNITLILTFFDTQVL